MGFVCSPIYTGARLLRLSLFFGADPDLVWGSLGLFSFFNKSMFAGYVCTQLFYPSSELGRDKWGLVQRDSIHLGKVLLLILPIALFSLVWGNPAFL